MRDVFLCLDHWFTAKLVVQYFHQAISEAYLGHIYLIGQGPAHYRYVYLQCRYYHIRSVIAELVEVLAFFERGIAELLVIIFQQIQRQGFAFLALGDGEYLVDVAAGTNGL